MNTFLVGLVVGLVGGGALVYVYGSYAHSKLDYITAKAQKLDSVAKERLKALL